MDTALSGKFASKIVQKMKAKKYNPIELFVLKGIPIIGSDTVTHEIVFDPTRGLRYLPFMLDGACGFPHPVTRLSTVE